MTTTTSRESDPPYPAEHVRWNSDGAAQAVRRAPTRGTEAVGAAFRAQVALRAPGVVMIPEPAGEADPAPAPAVATATASALVTPVPAPAGTGIRDIAAVALANARDHLLGLQDPRG